MKLIKNIFILCIFTSFFGDVFCATTRAYKMNNNEEELLKKELRNKFLTDDELEEKDSFFDKSQDYTIISGRVTDRDKTMKVLRIKSEMKNIKFFRSGDIVLFKVATKKDSKPCKAYVRDVEDKYFSIYVEDLGPCWGQEKYFRRGTVLLLESNQLADRIMQASVHRKVLLKRKRDFFVQLNQVNHFIWSYKQQKVRVAGEYDKRMSALKKAREDALSSLQGKKVDNITLQRELMYRLDSLDQDLEFYRIERDDLMVDRWHKDHDLGLPVGRKPQYNIEDSTKSF